MIRTVATVSILSLFTFGCGHSLMKPEVKTSPPTAASVSAKEAPAKDAAEPAESDILKVALPAEASSAKRPTIDMRRVGDFVVFRFSGSYRERPITVSQRVIERDSDSVVLEVSISEAGSRQRLHVRLDDREASRGDVMTVVKLQGDLRRPFGVAAYHQLMSDIMLSADANEAQLSSEPTAIDVGSQSLIGTRTRYRVRVGAHRATMETLASDHFAWGDLGGSIRTTDGKILYQAQVIDLGGNNMAASDVAVQVGEEDEPDYLEFE